MAQLANNENADALASLKAAHDAAMGDPKIPTSMKVNIDSELLAGVSGKQRHGRRAGGGRPDQATRSQQHGRVAGDGREPDQSRATHAVDAKDTTTRARRLRSSRGLGDPQLAVTANTLAAFAIARSAKPDYKRMQAYAEKALAIKPNDAAANFAEGIALTAQWAASHDDGTKKKAAAALDKADQQAKAEGNEALVAADRNVRQKESQRRSVGPVGRRQLTLPGL